MRPALIELLSSVDWKDVPQGVRQELERFQSEHLLLMVERADALARITRSFAAHAITFAVFKGPVLSVQIYDRLAAREYVDFDVIVPCEQVAKAESVLEMHHYRPAVADIRFRRFFLGYLEQWLFKAPASEVALDLHWSFGGAFLPFPLRADEPWGRLTTVSIAGQDVPTLGIDDLALLLAGHGTKEGWRLLAWIRDFAVLVAKHPDLDWIDIHRRAAGNGSGDSVLLACALAARILGTAVPMQLKAAFHANDRIAGKVDRIMKRLADGLLEKRHLDDLGLCDRRRDRLRARLRYALTPTSGDFDMLPLPRQLWHAYYLLRPIRLAAKAVRGTLPIS
jgi:hypothetical protein